MNARHSRFFLVYPLVGAFALFGGKAAFADDWRDAGMEGGRRIAIGFDGTMRSTEGPVSTTLLSAPRRWPGVDHTYVLWFAAYDCVRGERTLRARITYSGRRDPVQTTLDSPLIESGARNVAVAQQLRLVCGTMAERTSRVTYNNVGDFVEGRPAPH